MTISVNLKPKYKDKYLQAISSGQARSVCKASDMELASVPYADVTQLMSQIKSRNRGKYNIIQLEKCMKKMISRKKNFTF